MVLNISSSIVLALFVGFLVPLLLAHKSYFYGRGSYVFLNKSNIECIQGVSLIFILLHQVINQVSRPDLILQLLGGFGTGALAIYLFLAGVKIQNFSRYPKKLIRKKMFQSAMRLFLMFVVGNFLFGLVHIYLGEEVSFFEVLRHTMMGQFLDGSQATLIVTLFVFYLLVGVTNNIKVVSVLGLVTGWPGIFMILGLWTSKYVKVVFWIMRKQLLNVSLISGILLFLSVKWMFLLPIASVLGIMVVLMKVQFKSKIFSLLSQFSCPLYLMQLPILYLVFYSSEPRDSALILLTLLISLIVTILGKVMLVTDFKQLRMSR